MTTKAKHSIDDAEVGDRLRFTIRETGWGQGYEITSHEATVTRITANAVYLGGGPLGRQDRRYRITRKDWWTRDTRFVDGPSA